MSFCQHPRFVVFQPDETRMPWRELRDALAGLMGSMFTVGCLRTGKTLRGVAYVARSGYLCSGFAGKFLRP